MFKEPSLIDKLVELALAVIIYFSIFAAAVTAINTTNWTALNLTWVPTIVIILLAIIPVVAIVGYVKLKKK
jgi:hypothetical protein